MGQQLRPWPAHQEDAFTSIPLSSRHNSYDSDEYEMSLEGPLLPSKQSKDRLSSGKEVTSSFEPRSAALSPTTPEISLMMRPSQHLAHPAQGTPASNQEQQATLKVSLLLNVDKQTQH
jgi:hypothetical protein